MQVRILLRDHLADQHRIGTLGAGPRHQIIDVDLRAEVDDSKLAVLLEPLLPCETLDVEDRVDPDRVRVGADARADHDELAAQPGAHEQVDVLRGEQRMVALAHGHRVEVDEMVHPAVDDEEGEPWPHRLDVHDHRG